MGNTVRLNLGEHYIPHAFRRYSGVEHTINSAMRCYSSTLASTLRMPVCLSHSSKNNFRDNYLSNLVCVDLVRYTNTLDRPSRLVT